MIYKDELHKHALKWIKEAGEMLKQSLRESITVEFKTNPTDLVTNMDKAIEKYFYERVHETFPGHLVLGEEGLGDACFKKEGVVWIVDPIDGTMNFVHQKKHFAISLGIYGNGKGIAGYIYNVMDDELFYGFHEEGAFLNDVRLPMLKPVVLKEALLSLNPSWVIDNERISKEILAPIVRDMRGTRAYGSAALEMAYVACGRLDGYITLRLSPWDFAAGRIILEEVGGKISTLDGKPIETFTPSSVFASKPGLHREVLHNYLKDLAL